MSFNLLVKSMIYCTKLCLSYVLSYISLILNFSLLFSAESLSISQAIKNWLISGVNLDDLYSLEDLIESKENS